MSETLLSGLCLESLLSGAGAQLGGWVVRFLALAAGVLLWHWATAVKLHAYIRFDNVPSPESVAFAFAHNLATRDFYLHILVSLRRILFGYAIASALGIMFGVLVGRLRFARQVVTPMSSCCGRSRRSRGFRSQS